MKVIGKAGQQHVLLQVDSHEFSIITGLNPNSSVIRSVFVDNATIEIDVKKSISELQKLKQELDSRIHRLTGALIEKHTKLLPES